MYCQNCGKEIEDHSKFCKHCGTKTITNGKISQNNCEVCGEKIPLGFKLCPKCGNPIEKKSYALIGCVSIILTILLSLIVPIFGFVMGFGSGFYLIIQQNKNAKIFGVIVLVLTVIILLIWNSYVSFHSSRF